MGNVTQGEEAEGEKSGGKAPGGKRQGGKPPDTVAVTCNNPLSHMKSHNSCSTAVQSNLVTTYTWGLRRFVRCIDRTL